MAIAHNIAKALTSFITATGTQERAILIGGQAIRDWHAAQLHALTGTAMTLPVPRATTDMDVYLLIGEDREEVVRAIEADWISSSESSGGRVFQFIWRHDTAITLDLIATKDAQSKHQVQFIAKLGTGTDIGAVRVLEQWIIRYHLHERCFGPALAQLRMRRLNRLGLAASKAGAIGMTIDELIAAGRESREPKSWTRRLDKDLQDLELLLQPVWVDGLWEPQYEAVGEEIQRAWANTIAPLFSLQDPPPLMRSETLITIEQMKSRLPRRLKGNMR
jgi:hypothetical protein